MSKIILVIAAIFLTACMSLNVSQFAASPNVDLDPKEGPFKLELTADVKDQYEVPSKNGVRGFEVANWRNSLGSGFDSAFGKHNSAGNAKNSKTIQIIKAEMDLSPAAVTAAGGVAAAQATVTYQARLVAANGTVMKRSTGTVAAKAATTSPSQTTESAKSAVESMYEKIAEDFFNK
jgi:hypothetical protein